MLIFQCHFSLEGPLSILRDYFVEIPQGSKQDIPPWHIPPRDLLMKHNPLICGFWGWGLFHGSILSLLVFRWQNLEAELRKQLDEVLSQ